MVQIWWTTWWYRRGGREAVRAAAWQAEITTAALGVLMLTFGLMMMTG